MRKDTLQLASQFPEARHEDWLDLVDKTLRGKSFDSSMKKQSYDGIDIDALYTRDNARINAQTGISGGSWDICQAYWGANVKEANDAFMRDLERGATSLSLRLASGGFPGLPLSKDSMEAVFDGIHLNMCAVHLEVDEEFDAAGRIYLDLLDAREIVPEEAQGTLGADPVSTLGITGRLLTSLDDAVTIAATLAEEVVSRYPSLTTFNVAGYKYHNAGASEAFELAACLSIGVSYLRAMEAAGMDISTAASQIEFTLAADADMYMTVAKFRSFRRLWAKVLQACGVESVTCKVNAVSAVRMLSVRDPWVNILRGTVACFAAGIGGADSIAVLPHDTMLGLPTRFSRRIARNIQVILQDESYLCKVADPAAGAYAFETITTDLTAKAWGEFQKFESDGGFATCLTTGAVAESLAALWQQRKEKIDSREEALTGVSEFPDLNEILPRAGDMPSFVATLKPAGATMTPLKLYRSAEGFEALRNYSDTVLADTGKRPAVFLANLGPASQHTGRAMFAKNFFGTGGIESINSDGFEELASFVATFVQSGAKIAVLCGSDAYYESEGEVIVTALVDAGCEQVYVAGLPVNAKALSACGVMDFIHTGSDVLNVLQVALRRLGEAS